MSCRLVIAHCDDENLYKPVTDMINYVFDRPEVIYRGKVTEQEGSALTTSGMNSEIVLSMPGVENLISWIEKSLVDTSSNFANDKVKGVRFTRAWMNKMFKGCSGKIHTHWNPEKKESGVVSIFYFDVPENGSKLLVHLDGNEQEIEVHTGDLIMHDDKLPHSVSEHKNDKPRICIIFESVYV
jgi:hypothetical protein